MHSIHYHCVDELQHAQNSLDFGDHTNHQGSLQGLLVACSLQSLLSQNHPPVPVGTHVGAVEGRTLAPGVGRQIRPKLKTFQLLIPRAGPYLAE